jgi:SAM-dependent methyltransferase
VQLPPFGPAFHLVGLFDVLEHLDDDVGVLRDLRRLLAAGGRLLLTVPADPALWSYFDEASHHRRRYTPATLRAALAAAGFRVDYLTPFMAALYPLVWLGRRWQGRQKVERGAPPDPDENFRLAMREVRVVPGVNGLLTTVLAAEAGLVARRRVLPFGTSIAVVARPG